MSEFIDLDIHFQGACEPSIVVYQPKEMDVTQFLGALVHQPTHLIFPMTCAMTGAKHLLNLEAIRRISQYLFEPLRPPEGLRKFELSLRDDEEMLEIYRPAEEDTDNLYHQMRMVSTPIMWLQCYATSSRHLINLNELVRMSEVTFDGTN